MIFTLTDRNYNALDAYETDNYLIGKYVGSILETLDVEVAVTSLNAQYWIQGNYIMCVDASGHKYWFTIYDADDASNEDTKTISCYSGTIDIVSEEYPPIKATQTQPFEWYFNRIFLDTGIVLGVNEISSLTRKLEFESTNTTNVEMLQYVLNGFDNAEASLDVTFDGVQPTKLVLNVYRRIGNEMPQELLSTETDNLTKLERKGSISELATAMRATGQEVNEKTITLKGKYYEEKDSKGNILYYSPKDRSEVFSLVGHQNFYVNLPGKGSGEFDGYIVRDYQSQAKTQDALWAQTLAQLKKVDHANIEYSAEGYISCGIGDNVQLVALDMQPPVMVSARVTEYKFNDDDPTQNKYKFSNFVDLESNMSELDKIIAEIKKDIDYVVDTVTEYGQSVDNVTPPTEWTDELLDVPQGHYQWTRITQTMFKGGVNIAYLTAYVPFDGEKGEPGVDGIQGPKGDQGVAGPKGSDGKTQYTHIAYANSADGKTDFSTGDSNREYIGMYADFTANDSTNPSDYAWSKIKGADGSQGTAGKPGADGKTPYFHTAWANSADGKTGFSTTVSENKEYLGTYTDYTSADSTDPTKYAWSKIKGDKGEKGADGLPGKDGVGVKSTVISYALSTSGTTTPTSGWKENVPTLTKGQYLWTRTIWTYTDNSTETGYSTSYIAKDGNSGDDGLPGKDGVGIKSTTVQYVVSSSGTTKPTSGWANAIPTVPEGKFLWTKITWTYTDNTYEEGYSVAKAGEKGATGPAGAKGDPTGITVQSTVPTTKYTGMLWKNTGDIYGYIKDTTYRWNGSKWEIYTFSVENLIAATLSAITANLGNITAGTLNGVTVKAGEFLNDFTVTTGGVTYTGTTKISGGAVYIQRTGSNGDTWVTAMDPIRGVMDTYTPKSGPARSAVISAGNLTLLDSGYGGTLPARALNPVGWTNLIYSTGDTTAENNPCQYRKIQLIDGSWELQLRGQVKRSSGESYSTTASHVIGVLPAGYRPIRNELVSASDDTRKGARVAVLANGNIQINTVNGSKYVSIGGIRIAL